jgi:3-hydroxyacyl-CoA dehydrogenase / enoyl-CoA hydratase / 3-hydroxybutyryl-CoA epimerase
MPLLEIVRGEQTSDAALARALDFAAQIKKTPIVVNDSRGFFTSRVITTFINEAIAMLGEGFAPQSIEQAATQAGYPVGPLQLCDELNLRLFAKIRDEARGAVEAAGGHYAAHPAEAVIDRMIELGRAGRLAGAGFYDYDAEGKRTGLWSGLAETFPVAGNPADIKLAELSERMLVIEAVESARCLEEGVLITVPDANIGSIMGIGFPAWSGGVLQYINGYEGSTGNGVAAFVERADQFAKQYGARFEPNPLLRKKAENGEKF